MGPDRAGACAQDRLPGEPPEPAPAPAAPTTRSSCALPDGRPELRSAEVPDEVSPPGASRARTVAGQAAAVLVALTGYAVARGVSGEDPSGAVAHARAVVRLERRLGLFREPQLQALVVDHDALVDTLNEIYVWGHLPLIAVVLTWLAVRHPRQFVLTRNAVYASCAIALVVYTLYPVAPPRLAGLGLFDSVETRSHAYRVLQPPAFVNQYAAMPSMHMGWDLLMALALVRSAGARLVRRAAVLLPPLMLAAIVLTANHYLLDAVAGTVVALTGLAAAQAWERRQDRRRPVAAVAVPRPRTPT